MRRPPLAPLGFAALVAGCTILEPFATVPPAPEPGASAVSQRVAICYNTLHTTLAQVREAAQRECPADTGAEPADTDWTMQNCPVLLPARGIFVCTAKK